MYNVCQLPTGQYMFQICLKRNTTHNNIFLGNIDIDVNACKVCCAKSTFRIYQKTHSTLFATMKRN